MRHYSGWVWGYALLALTSGSGSVHAAWDNVFQTCCSNCNKPATSYYAPVAAVAAPCEQPCQQPCPQPNCTTRYVQRSYYQPVTTYKTETYYEPVTTYRTSYYYEPVTSYRTSCYYDPCTGCPQQVATPVTSYRLRSQCCPVQSYLARTACKPVTSYQMAYYWEPQTTCCQTSVGAPVFTQPTSGVAAPSVSDGYGGAPVPVTPGIAPSATDSGGYTAPPTATDSSRKPLTTIEPPMMPPAQADPKSYRQPQLGSPQGVPATLPAPSAKVRLDKIVSLPRSNVQGEVLDENRKPRIKARVLFVSADVKRTQEFATTDGAGSFNVTLTSGSWLVYTMGEDNRPVYHRKVEVRDEEQTHVTLARR